MPPRQRETHGWRAVGSQNSDNVITLQQDQSNYETATAQRNFALDAKDCAKRATFLAKLAALERGAESRRIAALATYYRNRSAALATGAAIV